MNQQQLIEQKAKALLKAFSNRHGWVDGLWPSQYKALNDFKKELAGAEWMQGEGERLRECYTKEQVIAAIKEECIATYGGLSHDGEGNEINTPYTCLGIIHAAFDRLTPKP